MQAGVSPPLNDSYFDGGDAADFAAVEDALAAISTSVDAVNRLRAAGAGAILADESLLVDTGAAAAAVEGALISGPGCDKMISCLIGRVAAGRKALHLEAIIQACNMALRRLQAAPQCRSLDVSELMFVQHSAYVICAMQPFKNDLAFVRRLHWFRRF
eukprot:SAG31_NODE_97_length_25714_cov_19.477142_20_plen_158_part_00